MGYVVTAQLDQHDTSRRWWAERLGLSPSTITKMADEPSMAFVEQFDLALAEDAPGQRLPPRLSDLYEDVRPEQRADAARVLEWLAREPALPQHDSPSSRTYLVNALLRSELALKRCQMRLPRHDVSSDPTVETSIRELLILASGPYGGSTVAHHRCVEIGLLVPDMFFTAINDHFNNSPVGFRLLRTLDRFVNVWRRREREPDLQLGRGRTNARLARLLRNLGEASVSALLVDPYPGAEWGIALARDCLRTGREQVVAREFLQSRYRSDDASDRERLYASWAVVLNSPAEYTSQVVEALEESTQSLSTRWARLFARFSEYSPDWTNLPSDQPLRQLITEAFHPEREVIEAAMDRTWPPDLNGVRQATASLILSALVTPDGKMRRNLVESIVAAGLVMPVAAVLVDVYKSGPSSGVREAIIFFLSRLRQPTTPVLQLFASATTEVGPVARSALWGLGDVFQANAVNDFATLLPVLKRVLELRPDSPGESFASFRERAAAAHALAVISRASQDNDLGLYLQTAGDVMRSSSPIDVVVARLCWWGGAMSKADPSDPFVDPTRLGPLDLLQV